MDGEPKKVDINFLASWVGSGKFGGKPDLSLEAILQSRLTAGEKLLEGEALRRRLHKICRGVSTPSA